LIFTSAIEDSAYSDGLWIVRPDGSELRALVSDQFIVGADELTDSISPDGKHLAYITSADSSSWFNGLTLHILTLSDGASVADIPLTSPETEPGPEFEFGDPVIEATRAITDVPSLAWSPDSTQLAFIGVIDGPSADLYLYSLADGSITRLTDGPSQGYQPMWSPDGRYILHAGADGFGTGAGYVMAGVWAARADGSEVLSLYTPDSGDEVFVGWVTNTTFLVYSWQADCGPQNLRTFDIETGRSQMLWEGCFEMAYGPESDTALIVAGSYPYFDPSAEQGTYLLHLTDGGVSPITDRPLSQPVWSSGAGAYFARTETGAVEIPLSGTMFDLPAPIPVTPLVSPDGMTWAWAGGSFQGIEAGLWVGPVDQAVPGKRFDGTPEYVTWSIDGKWLAFFSEDNLYAMGFADLSPRLIAADLRPGWRGMAAIP
jgi:WD40 repeat protein